MQCAPDPSTGPSRGVFSEHVHLGGLYNTEWHLLQKLLSYEARVELPVFLSFEISKVKKAVFLICNPVPKSAQFHQMFYPKQFITGLVAI